MIHNYINPLPASIRECATKAQLMSNVGGPPQKPAGRASVPMGWDRLSSVVHSEECVTGPSGSLAP